MNEVGTWIMRQAEKSKEIGAIHFGFDFKEQTSGVISDGREATHPVRYNGCGYRTISQPHLLLKTYQSCTNRPFKVDV
jgi:hypothetical protein